MLVYVATPLQVCQEHHRTGLYVKARVGLIANFTGISDPYEPPTDADMVVGPDLSPKEAAQEILLHLGAEGYIAGGGSQVEGIT